MRFIRKQQIAPKAFNAAIAGATHYDNLHGYQKKGILDILISEQKGLCAYCQQRISKKDATIEHLVCQSHNTSLDLEYLNLFAVCNGNEGKVETSHCDKFRANGALNTYFFPTILFEKSITSSMNNTNPFLDVEFNPRTQVVSGKLLGRDTNIKGFPNIKSNVDMAISVLNLNSEKLVTARRNKWDQVIKTQLHLRYDWTQLFNYYMKISPTDFHEFVLLAIRKQIL